MSDWGGGCCRVLGLYYYACFICCYCFCFACAYTYALYILYYNKSSPLCAALVACWCLTYGTDILATLRALCLVNHSEPVFVIDK